MSAGLPVHEAFYTWQGEGLHTGRAAYFIRTFGCPVQCPWCDAAGTWHPDWVPERVERRDPEALAAEAAATRAEFVVVTGGEPAIHDLGPLTAALTARGLPAHLETSGAFPIRGTFAFITVSPKWARPPLPEVVAAAGEIKLIVEDETSIARWGEAAGPWPPGRPVWLQPEWSRRGDPTVRRAISDWVRTHGAPYRATWQLHKLYRVDEDDPRSRPAAPLGGRPELGW